MAKVNEIRAELQKYANFDKAKIYERFFKTGPGEYAEGDKFLGITVPQTRAVAKKYLNLDFSDIKTLLHFPTHEERLVALLILYGQFEKGDENIREKIYRFYLDNTKYINNWDLIDLSADKIVGGYLLDKPKDILKKLARSESVWERRIAVLATFQFIKNGDATMTLEITKMLISDKHDLIQKALGWMLREIGKRIDEKILTDFLDKYASQMPRTMLRYAIERFDETKRQRYLKMK